MPKRKSMSHASRPAKRRRTTTNSKSSSNRTTTVIRSVGPVPPRTICRMKYSQAFASSGTVMDYIFRLNSVFDPDYSGIGHQPYGHDTYSVLYNRYRVISCSWRLTTYCSVGSGAGQVTVVPLNNHTAYTNQSLASETPRSITKVVSNNGGSTVFKGRANLPRLNGSLPSQYKSDDRFQAIVGTNPTETMGLHILSTDMGGNASGIMSHTIQLIYTVEWFDPIELGQS